MPFLKKLYLSHNQLRGTIPTSIGHLSKLVDLSLEGNHFVGTIPKLDDLKNLKFFNISNNDLEGPIPDSLALFDPTVFSGNKKLCGKPLDATCKPADSPPPESPPGSPPDEKNRGDSSMMIAILVVTSCGVALGLVMLVGMVICHRRRKQTPRLGDTGSSAYNNKSNSVSMDRWLVSSAVAHQTNNYMEDEIGKKSFSTLPPSDFTTTRATNTTTSQQGKLTFIKEDRHKFDLQDLLRASAEVLGSGNFGSSYKAVLMNGNSVAVKRFRQMNSIERQDFSEHMARLGRLTHPNLLPLVAYYYRKEEKLLVTDYVANGSLASHLHGNRKANQPVLDWPTRLKIVQGVIRGMSYLYKELPTVIVSHGHLRSSNVLLDKSFNAILMDYALIPVMNQEHARKIMIAYGSPEYIQNGRLSKKTDVWSLGILILELLTGKYPPPNYQLPTAKTTITTGDLVSWVDSIVKENEALQVFDKDLLAGNNNTYSEGEMLKLFQIGMACCEENVSERLSLEEAIEKIQELKVRDNNHSLI